MIHKGQELYYAQAGFADIAKGRKMERDTIVRLYSMSKPITAAAVMLLVERGIVDLWDPVEKYIPEFANMMVTADRTVDMGAVKAKRSVTVKDCMNMTSGLPYGCDPDPSSRDVGKVFDELDQRLYSDKPMTTVELAKRLGGCRLDFQPGEGWRYGTSADVLGAVVEVASGMRFGEFLEKEFNKRNRQNLLTAAKNIVMLNGAISRVQDEGKEETISLSYHPDDLASQYATDIQFFAKNCRKFNQVRYVHGQNVVTVDL